MVGLAAKYDRRELHVMNFNQARDYQIGVTFTS